MWEFVGDVIDVIRGGDDAAGECQVLEVAKLVDGVVTFAIRMSEVVVDDVHFRDKREECAIYVFISSLGVTEFVDDGWDGRGTLGE